MLERFYNIFSLIGNQTFLEVLEVEHVVEVIVRAGGAVREGFEHLAQVNLIVVGILLVDNKFLEELLNGFNFTVSNLLFWNFSHLLLIGGFEMIFLFEVLLNVFLEFLLHFLRIEVGNFLLVRFLHLYGDEAGFALFYLLLEF